MYMLREHDQFFTYSNEDPMFRQKKKEMPSGGQSWCLLDVCSEIFFAVSSVKNHKQNLSPRIEHKL